MLDITKYDLCSAVLKFRIREMVIFDKLEYFSSLLPSSINQKIHMRNKR